MKDLISRQAAIDIVNKYKKSHMILWGKPMVGAASIVIELEELPPVQPELPDICVGDIISRQAAIDALDKRFDSIPMNQTTEILLLRKDLRELPSAQPEQQWIPCSERLPEEDTEVLISYRYKEGEGDTDHVNIDITSYGTVCFGGREIHTLKEWRQPFDYFHANYEVIAWMPLPEPYKEK